ncbi:flagellar hook-associated protein FlgK [Clostridiaceae bacterium M8S5]|nr:flagellar hook-associated protein FlgK [Clostridiaceae bacterium M8S5]
MTNIMGTLSTAISGLYANNKALETTSHNIANVNNPNYVRQQAIQETSFYKRTSRFQTGTGVTVQQIRQIRNEFLDIKYREHSTGLGYYNSRNQILEQVQGIINETSGSGLQDVMTKFWNAWDELSKDASSSTKRGLLKQNATALVDTVNHYAKQLDDLQVNLNKQLKDKVNEINTITHRLRDLNIAIQGKETTAIKANDLRDERNALLDRLSEIADIDYYETQNGMVNVRLCGKHVVMNNNVTDLELRTNGSAFYDVYWSDDNIKVDIKSGEIAGIITARGDVAKTILGKNNGTVKQKVEIVIAVDTTSADMTKINATINAYKDDMKKRGLEPVFKLVTFGGGGTATELTTTFQNDITASFTTKPEAAEDFGQVVTLLEGMTYDPKSLRKLVVITDESIGGDGTPVSLANAKDYIKRLNALDVSTSVVSKEKYKKIGDTGEIGWEYLAQKTGGSFIDIDKSPASKLGVEISQLTTNDISSKMGQVKSYNEIIPSIKQRLNAFVNTIVRNVNYIHRQGVTFDGNPGQDFFVAINPTLPLQAGNIKLNDNLAELNNIAIGSRPHEADNGEIAKKIYDIRDDYIFGNLNPDNYFRDIVSDIGVVGKTANNFLKNKTTLRNEVDNKRKALSSVSLDEEMADMLKYQHSYAANSRVVNAVDDMLDRIINKVGIVGR